MYDDNGAVNTAQGQTNLPDDDAATAPVNSPALTPYDNDTKSHFPEKNPNLNQNDLPASNPPAQPAQAADNSVPLVGDGELQEIKRNALQNLLPIVGKLDQSPEEKISDTSYGNPSL